MQTLEKHVNFENENSRKAYYREFKKVCSCFIRDEHYHFSVVFVCTELFLKFLLFFLKVVEASDVILEVLDARDPLGCRCPQVEKAVIQSGTNKKIVLVLNKIGKFGNTNLNSIPFRNCLYIYVLT